MAFPEHDFPMVTIGQMRRERKPSAKAGAAIAIAPAQVLLILAP
jgi:hypothetical protein